MDNYEILSRLYDISDLMDAGSGLARRRMDELIMELEADG